MPRRRRHVRPGIPTTYKGVRMRSRLEARWARWFDFHGWEWEYEPLDLAGWLPDFSIDVPTVGALLVECKPALTTDHLTAAAHKAEKAAPEYRVVLLGASPRIVLAGAAPRWQWLPPAWWPTGSMSVMGWADAVNRTQWRPRR